MLPVEENSRSPAVLFRDECLLAVSKPSGMLVHRGWADDEEVLVDWVKRLTQQQKAYPVHRIDRGASGVVLFANDPQCAKIFQSMQNRFEIKKTYLALVRGRPDDRGCIDHPICRKPGGPKLPSRSEFIRLYTIDIQPRTCSLVAVIPKTGRLHQVRRHMKHINHPLIGDANYGKGAINRQIRTCYGLHRLALHACTLAFAHPADGREMLISAPLPKDLTEPFYRMGIPDIKKLINIMDRRESAPI